jgi:DNA-binding GntR family transcriptional regulator
MAVIGIPDADLYDYAEPTDGGDLVEGARSRYQRAVSDLRSQIIAGDAAGRDDCALTHDPVLGTVLKGQTPLAKILGVDTSLVNRVLGVMGAEGLIEVAHGRRTVVLQRSRWRITLTAGVLKPGTAEAEADRVGAELDRLDQPAVASSAAAAGDDSVTLVLVVESADLPGAVTAALPVARQLLGPLPIVHQAADEA